MQTKAQITGYAGEKIALSYLLTQDFQLVAQNFSCKAGEIDLIMTNNINLVFIEVRTRRATNYGSGAATITKAKQRKLVLSASYFLLRNPKMQEIPSRFDVVEVSLLDNNDYNVHWIPAAFTAF